MATLNVNLEHITMPRAENILQIKAKNKQGITNQIILVLEIDIYCRYYLQGKYNLRC